MKEQKTKIWLENDSAVSSAGIWSAQKMGLIGTADQIEPDQYIPKGDDLIYIDNLYYRKDLEDVYNKILLSDIIIAESVYVQESSAILNKLIRYFGAYPEFQKKKYQFYSISGDNLLEKLNNLQDYSESKKNLGNAIKCVTNNDVFECEMYNGHPKKIVFSPSTCEFKYEIKIKE